MAGTRLATQVAFILGILVILPVAIWILVPPSAYYLWRSPLSGDSATLEGTLKLLSPPLMSVQILITNSQVAAMYHASDVRNALKGVAEVAMREMKVDSAEALAAGAEGANSLFEQALAGKEPESFEYYLFVRSDDQLDVLPPFQPSDSHRYGWLNVPRASPSSLTEAITSSIRALSDSILREPQPSSPAALHQPVRVTLLNEDPDACPSCTWDFTQVLHLMEQETRILQPITRLSFLSEEANYGMLPLGDRFDVGNETLVSLSSLSSWSMEMGRTLPPSSVHGPTPPLHVVLVCPAHPLRFHEDGQPTLRQGERDEVIYVPRWGGAAILDPSQWPTSAGPLMPHEAHAYAAEVILTIVRRWLGLEGPLPVPTSGVRPFQVLSPVESDRLAYQSYRARLATSLTTLRNIQHVVEDPRGRVLSRAVLDHWHAALALLSSLSASGSLGSALGRVNEAAGRLEAAWGDVSLLPPPHFPLEHHAAVLVPLVVPLLVPLLGGLKSEWRRYKAKTRQASA